MEFSRSGLLCPCLVLDQDWPARVEVRVKKAEKITLVRIALRIACSVECSVPVQSLRRSAARVYFGVSQYV